MRRKLRACGFVTVLLLLFLMTSFQFPGTAAPAGEPITGKEWAAKMKMSWGPDYWPTKPVRGGVYQTASPVYIGLMNPNHWPVNDWYTIGMFYDKLIHTDGSYRPTVPWLAESWEMLDPLTVIMKLRQGVLFHDGSPFNAESVKYQMDWIMDRQNGAWTRAWLEPLDSVEVMDTYTLKWHFKRPWPAFIGVMANVPGYMISMKALKADASLRNAKKLVGQVEQEKSTVEQAEKEAAAATGEAADTAKAKLKTAREKLEKIEEEYKKTAALAEGAKELDNNPVGTGPYTLEEASPGNYMKLKRNPNWWFAKFIGEDIPYFDGAITNVIPDPSVRLASLRAGKLDNMYVDASQYPMVKNDRSLQIHLWPVNSLVSMRFNTQKGACKDIRVRQAISHALDRKALIAGVNFGLGRSAVSMFPTDHWCHNPTLQPVNYDPALSKKLLSEAGYKDGLTVKGYMSNAPESQTLAEAVKGMLAKVGVDWKVELLDPAAIGEKLRTADYDFAAGGWTWIFDPDLIATGLYHPDGGFNFGRSHNEKAIALIEAGRTEPDDAKRTKIYQELDKVIYDNYEDANLWYPEGISIFRKNVQGWNNDMWLKLRDGYLYSHSVWFKDGRR
ncbi:MAG: ABC transporter substrate-binding protein [Syntrophobacteraceae bacterium]